MLVKKSDATEISNSKDCTVWEYAYPSKLFSFATALINGRYPEEKRTTNLECEEVYYVLSGSGVIHSDKGDFEISAGDLYFFEKGEIYWTEGHKLSLVLVNAPKWSPEQHKIVD
ncbi:cupin domain-containing protein [Patescibacteria group bacterium]|nr:MAG: cupin domain-containing protein [Patescibacteria group bacterium]